MENNPFAALFSSADQAQQFSNKFKSQTTSDTTVVTSFEKESKLGPGKVKPEEQSNVNAIIENVFLITLNKETGGQNRPPQLVFLDELCSSLKQTQLDLDNLNQAVFDRLMLQSPGNSVIKTSSKRKASPVGAGEAGEAAHLRYLYNCFSRCEEHARLNEGKVIKECRSVILSNSRMCSQHPDFFTGLDYTDQFLDIFSSEDTRMFTFFEDVAAEIHENSDEGSVADVFYPVLTKIRDMLEKDASLSHPVAFTSANIAMFFTRRPYLAECFLAHSTPQNLSLGAEYENTVLGRILGISCLKKNEAPPYEFFEKASRSTKGEMDLIESRIHTATKGLNEAVYQIIYSILKLGGQPKNLMLSWIGNCLHANVGRAKMWSSQVSPGVFNIMHSSDGFFMNLLAVLLRLCRPFSEPSSQKLLKLQPSYCLATKGDAAQLSQRHVHAKGLHDQTFLLPPPEDGARSMAIEPTYNFITECFFMTHHCMHLGMHVLIEKFMKRNQDLHREQRLYREINEQGGQESDAAQLISERMDHGMTVYLSMKAALSEPEMLELLFDFIAATSSYLSHVGTTSDLTKFSDVTFPLPEDVPLCLTWLPEFIMENVVDLMLFIRRFKDQMYETRGANLSELMTLILVYMGSSNRLKNPHLRARLAEALDALMPPEQGTSSLVTSFHREQVFLTHPLVKNISETLLNVFVSIEMTGESVEFEAKFNYRRPMYAILKYMWSIDEHRDALQELAVYAEKHMDDTNPPLFLRFINLLINDTIYLLDEALSFMSQIKEKQAEKDGPGWSSLTPQQRRETDNQLRVLGMQARFHNIMGNSTICSLELLTQRIHSIFTNEVMVERITAMLNYSLLQLVGPKSKSLKVKDFDEYEFKPQELLSTISQIYLNLGGNDRFCLAVAADGRSYSKGLFSEVHKVLQRIGSRPDVVVGFSELSAKIDVLAVRQSEEDEAIENAPEEFLDAIMGTLMRDPVKLPSSGMIVDRPTIARHILSDQTDPFNRSPLNMDMVIPEDDLKAKIEMWLKDIHTKTKDSST